MLKKIFLVLLIIFAFMAASIYIFRANIKQYAVNAILKSFPLPNVALANVNYDETTGKLNLEEIKVKNPKGFTNEYIMEADSVDMDISITTKPQLQLDINDIGITNPVFYLERSRNGKWNFQEFQKSNAASPDGAAGDGSALLKKEGGFNFIKEAFAAERETKSQVVLPRTINIKAGTIHFLDNFIAADKTHRVDFAPIAGLISLNYAPDKKSYNKISFNGSCNIAGNPNQIIKGNLEIYPMKEAPSYSLEFNAYDVPLATIKPYLDRHTPFIVRQGSFNVASKVKAVNGAIDGDYTMELMNLDFTVNPQKSNIPFLETSVKKLTLYLTNQKGNVIIDFKQKGEAGGKIYWALGPIAKRAIGLMAIDTVIDVINAIEKGRTPGEALPGDIPPEVIDIFRGIFR